MTVLFPQILLISLFGLIGKFEVILEVKINPKHVFHKDGHSLSFWKVKETPCLEIVGR
jgi:hypothetical protein